MQRVHLLEKVKTRKNKIGMTMDNISKLSHLGERTVSRFFSGQDVTLSTLKKITNIMGLDFAGNEVIDIKTLRDARLRRFCN